MKNQDVSLNGFERLGVFADWRLPTDRDLRFIRERIDFQDVVLGVHSIPGSSNWKPRVAASRVEERIKACFEAGLDPVIMPWAIRTERAILEMTDWIRQVVENADSRTWILLDAEEDWYRAKNSLDPEAAADLVANELEGLNWGVTSIPSLPRPVVPLVQEAQFLVPQCYSFWKPTENHWSHHPSSFPGETQKIGMRVWRRYNRDSRYIMGLGCYWSHRPAQGLTPDITTEQALRYSAIETLNLGVRVAWFWSLKWLKEANPRGRSVRKFFGA